MFFLLLSLLLITYWYHRFSKSDGGRGVPVVGSALDELVTLVFSSITGRNKVVVDVYIRDDHTQSTHRPPRSEHHKQRTTSRRHSLRNHHHHLVKVEPKENKDLEIAQTIKATQTQTSKWFI